MDPLSICASILAIVAAANSTLKTLRKFREVWKAPKVTEDLIAEIEQVQAVLGRLSSFVESSRGLLYTEDLLRHTKRSESVITRINLLLVSSSVFSFSKTSDTNQARLAWLRHKSDVRALLDNLRLIRFDLVLCLGLITAYAPSCPKHSGEPNTKPDFGI